MGPKKSCNNGYYSLVMELMKDRRMDKATAEKEAERLWPHMSATEREPYTMRGKKNKGELAKMTAVHENMDFVLRQEQEERTREENMHEDISHQIRVLTTNNTISKEYFHIIHFNNFFVTTNNIYYPAEFAISRFNLQDGVSEENVFDMKVKPGKFPIGYMGTAKKTSVDTHKIPYMIAEDCNMDVVCRSVFEFLEESAEMSSNPTKLPAVYVKDDFRKITYDILHQMCDTYDGFDAGRLRIYSLSFLMFTLRNAINNAKVWISVSQSINELDKDVYDHAPEIPCEFHQQEECPVHCSRSHVVRMAYVVCDNCCRDMGIELIPGRHVPLDSYTSRSQPPASSYAASVASSYCGGTSAYTSSTAPSFRSNVDTVQFDDRSTVTNENSDGWTEVRPIRGAGRTATACSSTWDTSSNSTQTTKPSGVQGPRTDWRDTNFGNKGRGRGIATKK